MRHKTIFDPIFHIQVTFVKGDEAECKKFLERKYKGSEFAFNGEYALTFSLSSDNGFKEHAIYLSPQAMKEKNNFINTLAHESQHVTIKAMNLIGIEPEYDNHEAFCYVIGWITSEAYQFFK